MRVFLAMSRTGGGHRAIANAIATALRCQNGDAIEIETIDVFSLGRRSWGDRFTDLYSPSIRYAPWLYGFFYHLSDHRRTYNVLSAWIGRSMRSQLAIQFRQRPPDVIVSTHPLANRPILQALKLAGASVPVVATVTELVTVHRSWIESGVTLWTTATEEAKQMVIARGAPEKSVRICGLPVNERFGRIETSPAELRRQLGLDGDRFTALVIGGGEGAGQMAEVANYISQVGGPFQLLIVCGRNRSLLNRLASHPLPVPFRAFGFVDNVPELMHAADLVIGKGGPGTIAESLVAGRPIMLTQTLPGQEEGNGRFVEARGAGFAPAPPEIIARRLRWLAEDRAALDKLAVQARAAGRQNAAADVARLVGEVAARGAGRTA